MDKDLGGVFNTSNNNNATIKELDKGLGGVSNTHNNNNNDATIKELDKGLGGVSNTHNNNIPINDSLLHRFKRRLRQRSILQQQLQHLKTNIGVSNEMQMRQQRLDNQLKGIERKKRQNKHRVFNDRPSIAHIVKSHGIVDRLNSFRNSKNIKRMFSNGFKNAVDSLVDEEVNLECEKGCAPIQSV